ncbi:hypothetical protein VTJ49DRAFT_3619 [Mycothermus thermophilus]|uniref:DUF7730 domain-containing protein n=1 Tax=Humicola insolens TaxID=85995 RepID=A0ABR3V865_HUMIN
MTAKRAARKPSRMAPRASRKTPAKLVRSDPEPVAPPAPVSNAEDNYGYDSEYEALAVSDPAEMLSGDDAAPKKRSNITFLDLPAELRLEIYRLHFEGCDDIIDLDPRNRQTIHKKLAILRTCRLVYEEATHVFYSGHTFRIFPTQSLQLAKVKKPLLARLAPHQRRCIRRLELRLGIAWGDPPKSWVVSPALGLEDCINVRHLDVFVAIDPSCDVFNGYRKSNGFYERFCRGLLGDILVQMPRLERVTFDGRESVSKNGPMMSGLLKVTRSLGVPIGWGPERGWTDGDDEMPTREARQEAAVAPAVAIAAF